jgi:hypothetical protein
MTNRSILFTVMLISALSAFGSCPPGQFQMTCNAHIGTHCVPNGTTCCVGQLECSPGTTCLQACPLATCAVSGSTCCVGKTVCSPGQKCNVAGGSCASVGGDLTLFKVRHSFTELMKDGDAIEADAADSLNDKAVRNR